MLLVCLDDANYLFHDHILDQVLQSLLRLHEEYPGIRTGVIVTISDPQLFRALHTDIPMGYTLFFERLRTFRNRGLIDIHRPRNRGNTRQVLLRYDAATMRAVCENPE